MKIRHQQTGAIANASGFNQHGMGEVMTGDDSVPISELDIWLEQKQCWKSMRAAFRDHDLITDNYNTIFFEPANQADRERGYTL